MTHFHDTSAETEQRRLAEITASRASRRRITVWSVCGIVASVAVSLLIMSWGFSMDDVELGPTIFLCGALLGNVGIVLTLLWAYRASEG